MHKKLTITVDAEVYDGLHQVVGAGRISGFIEDLVRPHVIKADLAEGYLRSGETAGKEFFPAGYRGSALVWGSQRKTPYHA